METNEKTPNHTGDEENGNVVKETGIIETIIKKAKEILEKNKSNGIRYADLAKKISTDLGFKLNTVYGALSTKLKEDNEVMVPERGFYILRKYRNNENNEVETKDEKGSENIPEEDFYEPFATYLLNFEYCTKAIPLGGKIGNVKWGTPDVIGIYQSSIDKFPFSNIFSVGAEFISAEIKTDTSISALITSFGQACAYQLFSHKVYLVLPDRNEGKYKAEIERIEALCIQSGIGLVLFNIKMNKDNPDMDKDFKIRTRAVKREPDYDYLDKFLQSLRESLGKDNLKELFKESFKESFEDLLVEYLFKKQKGNIL